MRPRHPSQLDDALWNPISTAAVVEVASTVRRTRARRVLRRRRVRPADRRTGGTGGLVDAVDRAEPIVDSHANEPASGCRNSSCTSPTSRSGSPPATTSCSACWASFPPRPRRRHPPADRAGTTRRTGRDHGLGARRDRAAARARSPARCPTTRRRHSMRRPADDRVDDTAGTLAHWLAELGLLGMRAEAVQRHLELARRARVAAGARHRAPAVVNGLDATELAACASASWRRSPSATWRPST